MQFNNIKKQLLFLSLLIAVLSFSACRKGIQTIDKNAQEKTLAGNALALVAPGNIWYVSYLNGNDATASANDITKPFKTIQQAVYYSSPGDSIFLRGDAVHLLTQEVGINNVGTAAQHITIKSRPGESAIIDGSAITTNTQILTFYTAQFIDLRNLEIRNHNIGAGIYIGESANITLKNVKAHDFYRHALFIGSAVNYTNTNNITIESCVFYNTCKINPRNSSLPGAWPACVFTFQASNVFFFKNKVYNNLGKGVAFILCKGGRAEENTVYDNFSVNMYLDNATDVTFERNFIYGTGNSSYFRDGRPATGIQVANENAGYPSQNPTARCKVLNNIVAKGTWWPFYYGNYQAGGGLKDYLIANNTFYGGTGGCISIDKDAHSNTLFANNIFRALDSSNKILGTFDPALGWVVGKNNCWWGGNYANNNLGGVGDVWLDPKLVNPGGTAVSTNYKIQSTSPCINKGLILTQFTKDFFYKTRIGNYDIGAHEY
jgi:hypothetical protein